MDSGDTAVQYWLRLLREGTKQQQARARTELGLILESRGMLDEAIDAYETNVRARVQDRRPYEQLLTIYRERGEALSESRVQVAKDSLFGTAHTTSDKARASQYGGGGPPDEDRVRCHRCGHWSAHTRATCTRCRQPLGHGPTSASTTRDRAPLNDDFEPTLPDADPGLAAPPVTQAGGSPTAHPGPGFASHAHATSFSDIPNMPHRTLDELREARQRGDVDIGVGMDHARQWLERARDRVPAPSIICQIGTAMPLWFGPLLVYSGWTTLGGGSLLLLVPAFVSWLLMRPMAIRMMPLLGFLAWGSVLALLVGLWNGSAWLTLGALSIVVPWAAHTWLYRFASGVARAELLKDERLFLDFWNLGSISLRFRDGRTLP
jgi:hypothetical protein